MNTARVIDVNVLDTSYWGRGAPVRLDKLPLRTPQTEFSSQEYLAKVVPGRLEYAHRPSIFATSSYFEPGSLFFKALHACFAQHYAFGIRPEVLAYLINHELAACVKENPDHYRGLFTARADKELIEVRADWLVLGSPSGWDRAIGLFDAKLQERVSPSLMSDMLTTYSTSTPESNVAQLIAFMDAASPFYDYQVTTRCGIPQVRLFGEPADYRRLYEAVARLEPLFRTHLATYFQNLLPVLDKIAQQADPSSEVDNTFWSSIYKYLSESGTQKFNGWSMNLIAYVRDPSDGTLRRKDDSFADYGNLPQRGWGEAGMEVDEVSMHVSSVPFIWDYYGDKLPMRFAGGVLGIEPHDGALTPELSFAVIHDDRQSQAPTPPRAAW